MGTDLTTRIEALDDKQAIYVVQRLSEALFKKVQAPAVVQMASAIDQAGSVAGMDLELARQSELSKAILPPDQGGAVARALLVAWAEQPELAPAVEYGIEQFKTAKQDFGILSVPVALGLTYALIAMDLNVDLGFVKIKKAGITGADQAQIVKKTLAPVLKGIRAATGT